MMHAYAGLISGQVQKFGFAKCTDLDNQFTSVNL